MTIFEQLYKATIKDLKSFKSDLEIDKKTIENEEGKKFIHITRATGTSLFMFFTSKDYPQRGEKAKYLFGKAEREKILKGQFHTIEYYAENNPISAHYFDGEKLTKVNIKKAVNLFKNHLNTLLIEWEDEERKASLTHA